MPLNLFYTMVQKSRKWPKTQIKGGSCLNFLSYPLPLRARSHWVRIALISIKGFSRCARITVTLRFRAGRIWIEVGLCVCNVPKRRPPSSSAKHESVAVLVFPVWEELLDIAEGAQELCLRSSVTSYVAPPQTLSLSSGEWVPSKIHPGRERISGVATSTCCWQRSIWPNWVGVHLRRAKLQHILGSNLALFRTHDCTPHKATCKKGRLSVRKTSPGKTRKSPPLEKNRRDSELFG